jgi:S1-C subfamily serine protease
MRLKNGQQTLHLSALRILPLVLAIHPSLAVAIDNPYAAESSIYKVEVRRGNKLSSGTGFLISHDKILTNCHVVHGKGQPAITLINRKTGVRYYALRYYGLGPYDACVLVGGFGGEPLSFTTSFEIGQNVWQYGYPHGVKVVGQGAIMGLFRDSAQGDVIQSSSFCNPGSSGGPLLNNRGQVVGLNFAVPRKYDSKCLSIPSAKLLPYLNR